jgi:tRNA G18 (ribose-2'-O)-methylase SpoU
MTPTIPRLPLTVILNNVRSAYNVGAVFRTADGAWIERVRTWDVEE